MVTQSTPADQHNDQARATSMTVPEWCETVTWTEVLSGQDLEPSQRWVPVTESDTADPTTATAWHTPEMGSYAGADPDVVLHPDGDLLRLADGGNTPPWWPAYPVKGLDKFTVWAGVRNLDRHMAAEALDIVDKPVHWEWFWQRPGLSTIRDVADQKRVSRFFMLGVTMAWTLAHVQRTAYLGGDGTPHPEGALNMYVCLVGKSGSRKSTAMMEGPKLVTHNFTDGPEPVVIDSGSGEGIARVLSDLTNPKRDDDDTATGNYPVPGGVMQVDENTRFLGERRSENSTLPGYMLTLWNGGRAGASLKDEKDSRELPAMSYRFCVTLNAQPKYARISMAETDNGLAQRWLFMDAERTAEHLKRGKAFKGKAFEPIILPAEVVRFKGSVPDDPGVEAELEEIDMERAAADPWDLSEDDYDSQATVSQKKVAIALAAIIHGRLEVTRETWELAAHVMEVSAYTIRQTLAATAGADFQKSVDRRVEMKRVEELSEEQVETEHVQRVAALLEKKAPTDWSSKSVWEKNTASRDRKRVPRATALLEERGVVQVRNHPSGDGLQVRRSPRQ